MQTSFDFTPGLTVQFSTLRDVINAAVYTSRASLNGVAADLDTSPSLLGRMLNRGQDDARKLDVDDFVRILVSTGDTRPIQWLVEKFLHNPEQQKAIAAVQIAQLLPGLIELAKQAGIATAPAAPTGKGRR